MRDVLIIGGGPSGAHFAAQAAKKGYSVTLIEKNQLGRAKCCAGGLSGRFLESYTVPSKLVERQISSFAMVSPVGEKTQLKFNKTAGITVNRAQFDKWTLEQATDSGCEALFEVAVKNITIKKDYAEVNLSNNQTLNSRLIVGAFGMSPQVFKQLELKMPEFSIGLQAELTVPEGEIDNLIGNEIEFCFNTRYSKSGYSWVFPKKQTLSLGLVTNPDNPQKKKRLWDFISNYTSLYPNLKQYLPRRFDDLKLEGAMLPNTTLKQTYGDRFMLIGDAAGMIDPPTWEGIYFAFKSADIALDVFDEQYDSDFSTRKLHDYQKRWARQLGKEIHYGRRIQKRAYGSRMDRLWNFTVQELNRNQPLKQLVTEELSKDLSIPNMVEKIPLSTKLQLIARYSHQK
ncbi:MAG: NAD(P)/FAD-dependent oxidoreductase [Candidatus Bathyarchaeota archaeon]|nr:NAD(P)/FAD-dependent oxidoreductase [Candidatus Bathyarchaeota archaeon]